MALKPVIVGLTGGVGSGKTYVARMFRGLGARIIDADKIARLVIERPFIRRALVKWHGRDILGRDGMVNRRRLAQIVFIAPDKIRRLNRLTHPYIRKEILKQARRQSGPVIVIDAPLLLEARLDKLCDYLVFVRASVQLRRKRVLLSRGWDAVELRNREKFQVPVSQKKGRADFIVDNNSSATVLAQAQYIFRMITARK